MRGKWIAIMCLVILIVFIGQSSAQETKEITCTGKVVNAQSKPVSDAKVKFYKVAVSSAAGFFEIELVEELTTKDDGSFTIKTRAGENELYDQAFVLIEKEGLAMGWANWRLQEDLDVEIQLSEAKILAGVVVDDAEKPVADAVVCIAFMMIRTGQEPQFLMGDVSLKLLTIKTDSQGKFSFGGIPEGATAEFSVKKAGRATISTFDTENFRGEFLQLSAGQTDIKIVQPIEAKIEGVVVEKQTGKPVAGVKLMTVRGRNRPNFGRKPIISKEDGSFVINALDAGEHILQLVPQIEGMSGWIAEPVEVNTEAGKTKSGVKVELIKGGVLEVAITEAENKEPVEKASVVVLLEGSNTHHSALTDGDGIARIRLLPGEYRVAGIHKQGYSSNRQQETITIEDGKTERVELQLAGQPKITGVVRNEKGKPVKGAKLNICPMGRKAANSDADGKFEVNWDPGNWGRETPVMYLICRYEDDNLAAIEEVSEDTKTIDLKLEPALIIAGKVVDPNEKAIEGASVRIFFHSSNYSSSIGRDMGKTNAEGSYEIKAIPQTEQKYSVHVEAEDFGPKQENVDIDSAVNNRIEVDPMTLALANLSVSGKVVDVNDDPIADIRVYCYGQDQPHRMTQTDSEGKFTLEKVCAGRIRINANTTQGGTRLRGNVQTEGGATDVRVVLSERQSSRRYVPKRPPSLVGKALPDLKDLNVDLSPADLDNKMILVCFWDMEQRPSRYYIRQVAKEANRLKQKGIVVVAVQASKIDQNALDEWVKEYKIPFAIGMVQKDTEKAKFKWGFRALPWMILTDANHVVSSDGFSLDELNKKIQLAKKTDLFKEWSIQLKK